MTKTMIFNGIEVPIVKCTVTKLEPRPFDRTVYLDKWLPTRLIPLGPEPKTEEEKAMREQIENQNREITADAEGTLNLQEFFYDRHPPTFYEITIEFPTFKWTAHREEMFEKITQELVEDGQIEGRTLVVFDDFEIDGRVEPLAGDNPAQGKEISELQARSDADGLQAVLKRILDGQTEQAANAAETHRLLHRTLRKVEGVPPVLDKLALAGKDMAAATQQFRHTVKLDDADWEIFDRMELRNHNQSWVARDLGMEPYQVSRAWKRIRAAWAAAGYPLAEKVTRNNAVLGEDGVVYKKTTERRKRRG